LAESLVDPLGVTMTLLPEPDLELAATLFAKLEQMSLDPPGVTRDAYGSGEERAHALIRETGRDLGLEVDADPAGNTFVTLPAAQGRLPGWIVGSHLDSVVHGGNFDGAAGVVAAMSVIAGFLNHRAVPHRPITCAVFRAEESTWFPASYIGSRAALGLLAPDILMVSRSDSGKSLARHMEELGFQPERVARGETWLKREAVHAYLEIHIEQGPVLDMAKVPVGLVTAIAGSVRYRDAVCRGRYDHSGAVPRDFRSDAVLAVAELAFRLDRFWADLDRSGANATITMGQIATDPEHHAFSKVAGEVSFCLDIRADRDALLATVHQQLHDLIAEIGRSRRVTFDLGARSGTNPAPMDGELVARLHSLAAREAIPTLALPSGAGHDAAVFADAGIPAGMIFIRSHNGSHNPLESMEFDDFREASRLLAALVSEDAID
jgi:beta-ureidopropionase / N-carbamoyl-L-amino-acid hydrolase